jgi:hypothetical protein
VIGTYIKWGGPGVALFIALSAATGIGAQSSTQVSMEAGGAFLDLSPAAASSLSAAFERAGDLTAFRASCTLQGRANTGAYGSAEGRGEFSWTPGGISSLLVIEGGVSGGDSTALSWRGSGSLALNLDGLDLSGDFKAGLERRSDLGVLSTLATSGLGASFVAGEFLLKPRFDASASFADLGTTTWTFLPGLGLSWYPGLPISASFAAGWSRAMAGNSEADSLVAEASLYAAAGPLYGSLDGSATIGTGGVAEASAAFGLSLDAGRIGKARLGIPLRFSYVLDGSPVMSLFAGISLSLD